MFEELIIWTKELISQGGYWGICLLMTMESMFFPIPSEAVMPFAGYLIGERFSWWGVLLASSSGSLIGSYLSYLIGCYGGRAFLTRYGKYLLISAEHLSWLEEFFTRYGSGAVFLARFIPGIRHISSIPAGLGRMPLLPFFIFTGLGASLWNMFLAWLGYTFKGNQALIHQYKHYFDFFGLLLLIGLGLYIAWKIKCSIKKY